MLRATVEAKATWMHSSCSPGLDAVFTNIGPTIVQTARETAVFEHIWSQYQEDNLVSLNGRLKPRPGTP